MNETAPARWLSLGDHWLNDFEDEMLVSCFVGKLFHFWEGRNAWWGTWSQTYPGDDSFSLELEEAKDRIERRRTKGSVWTIAELPALVLRSKAYALIIAEINTDRPLSEISLPRTFVVSLNRLAELFAPRKPNSIYRFVGASSLIGPAKKQFFTHRSESQGGYYKLGWNTSNAEVNLRPFLRILARIRRQMQKQ